MPRPRGFRLRYQVPRTSHVESLRPLSVPEAAALAGTSQRSLYRRIREGVIPGVFKVGHTIKISRPVFTAWLAAGVAVCAPSTSSGAEPPGRMTAIPREDAL